MMEVGFPTHVTSGDIGLSTTAWAFVTLQWLQSDLLAGIAHLSMTNMATFKPEELRMTLWALSQGESLRHALLSYSWSILLPFPQKFGPKPSTLGPDPSQTLTYSLQLRSDQL